MKKFTSLLIGCSLALAGAAMAQQPDEQASPKGKKEGAEKTTHATEAKTGAKAQETGVGKHQGAKVERAGAKGLKADTTPKTEITPKTETPPKAAKLNKSEKAAGTEANVSGEATPIVAPGPKGAGRKGMKANANANAKASPSATVAAATASATPVAAASASATPVTAASASATPAVAAGGQQNARGAGAAVKKPDPTQVQQIKQQHANFRAQPKPDKVPAVTFNQSYRIEGSDRWQGPQYEVFRSYRPERHDERWYHSHYPRVELIGGGYYYMNNGYWYPAWGYNPSNEYYAYDGPIYVGHRAEPPDRVIADVQSALQQMGYYQGEVDGLLGPLTRQALTAYQADNGLATTAAIDEPTLNALDMG